MLTHELTSHCDARVLRPWLGYLGVLGVVVVCAAFAHGSAARDDSLHNAGNSVLALDGPCGMCDDDPENNLHVAIAYRTPQSGWGEGGGWHGWWFEGQCLYKHGLCIFGQKGGGGTMAEVSGEELIDDIVRATAERDVAALTALARAPSVRINTSRMSMQLVGCDGTNIVAHVPVDPKLLSAIEVDASQVID